MLWIRAEIDKSNYTTDWYFVFCRTATARGKAEQADISAVNAREDSEVARLIAKELAPDFLQPGMYLNKPCILCLFT